MMSFLQSAPILSFLILSSPPSPCQTQVQTRNVSTNCDGGDRSTHGNDHLFCKYKRGHTLEVSFSSQANDGGLYLMMNTINTAKDGATRMAQHGLARGRCRAMPGSTLYWLRARYRWCWGVIKSFCVYHFKCFCIAFTSHITPNTMSDAQMLKRHISGCQCEARRTTLS